MEFHVLLHQHAASKRKTNLVDTKVCLYGAYNANTRVLFNEVNNEPGVMAPRLNVGPTLWHHHHYRHMLLKIDCSPSSIIWYLARAFMLMRRNVAAGIGSNEEGEYCRAALQRSDRKEPRYKWPTLLFTLLLNVLEPYELLQNNNWRLNRKRRRTQCRDKQDSFGQ